MSTQPTVRLLPLPSAGTNPLPSRADPVGPAAPHDLSLGVGGIPTPRRTPVPGPSQAARPVPPRPGSERSAPARSEPGRSSTDRPAPTRHGLDRSPGDERAAVGLVVEPQQASMMVAVAAVEVLSGARQQVQLVRWLLPDVYEALGRRAALVAASTPGSGSRRPPPVTPISVRAARRPGWREATVTRGRGTALAAAPPGAAPIIGRAVPAGAATARTSLTARATPSEVAAASPSGSGRGPMSDFVRVTPPIGRPDAPSSAGGASAPVRRAELPVGGRERVGGTIAANGLRAVVVVLRMVRVDEDTVESAVVVQQAERVRAVAVRLVRRQGRWRAAALEIG